MHAYHEVEQLKSYHQQTPLLRRPCAGTGASEVCAQRVRETRRERERERERETARARARETNGELTRERERARERGERERARARERQTKRDHVRGAGLHSKDAEECVGCQQVSAILVDGIMSIFSHPTYLCDEGRWAGLHRKHSSINGLASSGTCGCVCVRVGVYGRERQTSREERERQSEREREIQRERKIDRARERKRERGREGEKGRARARKRASDRECVCCKCVS